MARASSRAPGRDRGFLVRSMTYIFDPRQTRLQHRRSTALGAATQDKKSMATGAG